MDFKRFVDRPKVYEVVQIKANNKNEASEWLKKKGARVEIDSEGDFRLGHYQSRPASRGTEKRHDKNKRR